MKHGPTKLRPPEQEAKWEERQTKASKQTSKHRSSKIKFEARKELTTVQQWKYGVVVVVVEVVVEVVVTKKTRIQEQISNSCNIIYGGRKVNDKTIPNIAPS